MDGTYLALYVDADHAARAIASLPPRGALAREMRLIRRAEIAGSTRLAGSELSPAEVDALIDRGQAEGNHALDDYVRVRAYADAARWIGDARPVPVGDPRPLLSVDELRQLHARATAGASTRGGAWRQTNHVPNDEVVAPAAWLVAREVTTLVDRYGRGPRQEPVALWLARFLGRFTRLRPFEDANGRTGRLVANLLLRRLDYPPLVFEQRAHRRYAAAITAAETDDPHPLATLIAHAIINACNRLQSAAEETGSSPQPLRSLAGSEYTALAKAAQRGRLRTILRGGRYFTTPAWIADYRRERTAR